MSQRVQELQKQMETDSVRNEKVVRRIQVSEASLNARPCIVTLTEHAYMHVCVFVYIYIYIYIYIYTHTHTHMVLYVWLQIK